MFQTPAATPPDNNLQNRPFITPERPIRAPEPPKGEPGEFTRMFQTPPATPPPQARPADPGEFNKFFQTPQQSPSGPTAHPAYKDPFAKATDRVRRRVAAASLLACLELRL